MDARELAEQRIRSLIAVGMSRLDAYRDIYRDDPLRYGREILGVTLTKDQERLCLSVRDNRRTLCKASHAIGKTFTAAVLSNWWYDCWAEHIVYVTAPTWTQVKGLTFKQTKNFRLENKLDGEILDSGLIRDRDRVLRDSHFIRALNAEKGEGFQGEHSAPILVIFEEGVGVPKHIWEAAEGLMTDPRCRMFAIGNPTDESGAFGAAALSSKWNTLSISCLDHPNIEAGLKCEEMPYPRAVSLLWLKEMIDEHCDQIETEEVDAECFEFYSLQDLTKALDGHPIPTRRKKVWYKPDGIFQGRTLGQFPTEASNKVIPSGYFTSVKKIPIMKSHGIEIGCDTARFGDDRTSIFARIGPCLVGAKVVRRFDSYQIVKAIEDLLRDIWRRYYKTKITDLTQTLAVIKLDVTGGLGSGPLDILTKKGHRVLAVNSSSKAHDDKKFKNRRSELWFDTRARLRSFTYDDTRLDSKMRSELRRELSTPTYDVVGSGLREVEPKKEIKKRLGESPDLADGLNICYSPDADRFSADYASGGRREDQY